MKIGKAIRELDYRPNFVARSLVKKSSNIVGFIIRDITNSYYSEMIKGVEEFIKKNNLKYSLLLSNISKISENIEPYVEPLLSNKVAGILSTSENLDKEYMHYLKKIDIPIVFIDSYKKEAAFDFSYVTIDDFKGAFKITDFLISKGHRDICFICTTISSSFKEERVNGFKAAFKKNGIKCYKKNFLFLDDYGINEGYKAAQIIFKKNHKPTAILCINDETAYGVMNYCHKNNILIPENVSIAGFDDTKYSSLNFINLTTVNDPVKEIGHISASILFDKIFNKNKIEVRKIIEPEIIIRNSIKSIS